VLNSYDKRNYLNFNPVNGQLVSNIPVYHIYGWYAYLVLITIVLL